MKKLQEKLLNNWYELQILIRSYIYDQNPAYELARVLSKQMQPKKNEATLKRTFNVPELKN